MKKKGYTLAEALVSMAIVGVLAALLLPLTNKFRPDSNKITYLKTYDSLVQILQEAASNTELYPLMRNVFNGTISYTNAPFYNTAQVNIGDNYVSGRGNSKLCTILAYSFGQENNAVCNGIRQYTDANFANNISFTTNQGVQFSIFSNISNVLGGFAFDTRIAIDVNGEDTPNCMYAAGSCDRPDRFLFYVSANGHLEPADQMGQAYLRTRANSRIMDYDMGEFRFIQTLADVNNGFWVNNVIPDANVDINIQVSPNYDPDINYLDPAFNGNVRPQ